ncbi:MAG: LCP family protein [Anaerolineae bacterium]|nr:LCP family protein [Anaerolineae bacterium]
MSTTIAQKRNTPKRRGQPPLWLRLSIAIFLIVFIAGSLYSGYLFYATIREIVARAELPALPILQLPSFNLSGAAASETIDETPPELPDEILNPAVAENLEYQPPPAPTIESDRINILLLGIDRRSGKSWRHLTDTIIVVTVDQTNKTAGMMSIPRDLQLTIPSYGEDRINTANVYGESRKYPGGGPALLKRTIEYNFGIPIDYYIMVDFKGFEKIVDTLGGIGINVPRALHDTKYPDPKTGDPYAYKTVHFNAGYQHMNGARALEYARSRMSSSDFDRARRQQLVLLAIREKALSLNVIPKIPSLALTMGDSIKTDMSVDDMLELAQLGLQVDLSNVKQLVLQPPLVYGHKRADGAAIQLPVWDKINPAIADLFATPLVMAPTPTPAPPTPIPTMSPDQVQARQDLAKEGARIAVQNGTAIPNFAARVAAMLMQEGYQVVEFGDADRLDYTSTVIIDYTGKASTLQQLVNLFQVLPENVRPSDNVLSPVDIRIIVGQDFSLPLP